MPNPDGSPTSEELKNGGVPTNDQGATVREPRPIGVPYKVWDAQKGEYVDWKAQVTPDYANQLSVEGSGGPASVAPRYFDGDELRPANWDPERIKDLQVAMISAGLIPKSANVRLGRWDLVSQKAFTEALGYANASGTDFVTAIQSYGEAEQTNPNEGRAPLTKRLTNPDDLRSVFRKVYMDTTGIGPDSATVEQMIAAYQAQEAGYQTQAYDVAETGGTVTAPPDPQVFAETQARQADPLGAQEHDVIKPGGPLDSFKSMLDGWLV